MDPFLQAITTFPTVPLTVTLGVVVGYWIFALISGAAFHGGDGVDAVTGGVKAAGDATTGAIKGASEAMADAIGGHDAVGGHDIDAGGGDHAGGDHDPDASDGQDGGLLSILGLGKVPVTITFSAAALLAWTICTLMTLWINPVNVLLQVAVLGGALTTGLLGAALVLRPLGKALDASKPARRRDSLGQVCTITSGKVDATFGTAQVADGAAGLNVHVVCPKANTLKKGDRALLVDFDATKDVYEIEPIDWLLPQEIEALNDPARAAQIISGRVRRR
jgi:hypothetical protein